MNVSPYTTLPEGFGLDWIEFTRRYYRYRVCFLFLPILRCFSSRRSPLREAIAVGIPIRKSTVLSLRATPCSFSQLGTSFVGA